MVFTNKNWDSLISAVKQLQRHTDHFRDVILELHAAQDGASAAFLAPATFQLKAGTTTEIAQGVRLQSGELAHQVGSMLPGTGPFVVESWRYSAANKAQREGDIKHLAELLTSGHYSSGILNVVGYADDADAGRFELVFAMPPGKAYETTLRSLLLQPPLPLNVRVDICKQLAEAVLHIHQLKLVHKNFSSANAIVMQGAGANGGESPIAVFLTNWRLARVASDASRMSDTSPWWEGIYLHPKRQVELHKDKYNMGHDVYSLGVCMLETLLSGPLVRLAQGIPEMSPIFKARADALGIPARNHDIAPQGASEAGLYTVDKKAVQEILVSLASVELPAIAGTKLKKLVISCLTCLEGGFEGISFAGNDIEVGMNFIHLVKSTLGEIYV